MKTISEQELKDILDKHGKWLRNEEGAERANLRSANLRSADLRYANLRYADLRSADLSYANLSSADLRSANLSSADLRSANLSYADLRSADLRSANLRYADLRYANLRYADLSSADLRSANLRYADGFKFMPLQIVNTKFFITILDDHVLWGCKKMTFKEVKDFLFSHCTTSWDEKEFNLNKKIITELIRYYRPEQAK